MQCLHEAVGLVNDDLLSNFTLFGQWSSCQHGIAENTRTILPDMPSYSNASSHPKRRDLGPRHTIRMPRCLGPREVTMWIHSWKWKWKWKWNTAMRCSFEVNQSCCTDPPCRRFIWSFELALYRHNMPATENHASNMLIWLEEWAWKASHLTHPHTIP